MLKQCFKYTALKVLSLCLLLSLIMIPSGHGADHIIGNHGLLEEYFWTYGCTPTASSMVLSYWDNYVAGIGKITGYGRLINYYYNNSCGNSGGSPENVPNTIDELRTALNTDWNINTCSGAGTSIAFGIEGGLRTVTNDLNGYNFTYWTCWDVLGTLDWCWGEVKNQIDNGRPLVWTATPSSFSGHTVPVWGYRDDKYLILYDTWSPGGQEDWYYRYYLGDPSQGIAFAMVNGVTPGGSTYPDDLVLDSPIGGETIMGGHPFTIWWYQYGMTIATVDIDYSLDGGLTWAPIGPPGNGYWMPSMGNLWNSFVWSVPNIPTNTNARVRITGYSYGANGVEIAGDGSVQTFRIQQPTCSTLFADTYRWQRVWYDYPGGNCLGDGPDVMSEDFDSNWGSGTVAHGRNDAIQFRSGRLIFTDDGKYRITVGSDDGVRLWIDGILKIDRWYDRAYATDTIDVPLSWGYHDFRLDYYENIGDARVSFAMDILPDPDLVIQNIEKPTLAAPGENITVTVTVRNQSAGPADGFWIDFYKNLPSPPGNITGDFYCFKSGLAAGATDTCTGTVSYPADGIYHMWAQVDTENTVAESHENNNTGTTEMYVGRICMLETFYPDADRDGYGTSSFPESGCTPPFGYSYSNTDCNDDNYAIHPDALEVCDGLDNNCNGVVDDVYIYYRDADGDGYGDPNNTTRACTQPAGYVGDNSDCNDGNAFINPGIRREQCNNIDDNCNGTIDENLSRQAFCGVGECSGSGFETCSAGSWGNSTCTPGTPSAEMCDHKDNDCDGQTDEGVTNTYYRDSDGDGYGNPLDTIQDCSAPAGYVADNTDCNDKFAGIHPGAMEICANDLDDNCNGVIDEKTLFYPDADGDGYGNPDKPLPACEQPAGFVPNGTDCNDFDKNVHPGALEVCNGADDNCNGQTDEGFDIDGDGWTSCAGDCNDDNSSIHPGAAEVCDGLDNNCNGLIDEGVLNTYYKDSDADGYGNPNIPTSACSQPEGYVTDNTDCNDKYASIHPGAVEVCRNELDDNCNGLIDEGINYYPDEDGDGFGNPDKPVQSCEQPAGFVLDNTDCNDADKNINPVSKEVCTGVDDNCNGLTDEGFDADDDTIADCFDNCPKTANKDQLDSDKDGFGDVCDNCRLVSNPDQRDDNYPEDDDPKAGVQHYGDVCDPDFDNDGMVTLTDYATWRKWYRQAVPAAPAYVDLDNDNLIGLSDYAVWRKYYRGAPGP